MDGEEITGSRVATMSSEKNLFERPRRRRLKRGHETSEQRDHEEKENAERETKGKRPFSEEDKFGALLYLPVRMG